METNSVYIYIPDEKLKIYGDLLRIITAQSMEYFSSRPKEHTQMILFCLDEFASFGKLQITEALRKLRKRHIRIMVLTQSLADLDMIYGKDERKAMLGNFKFTVLLGCKDTETQEYFSKMIGEKRSPLETDSSAKPQPIIKPADLAHLEQDLFVICDDGAIRLRKNFYFQYEQDIFEKTNSLRVNSGLSELTYRSDLQFAADIRVEEILQNYIIYGSIDGKWGAHTRPDHSSAGTALGDKSDLACGENAAMESCIFDEEHLYYLWYNSKGHRDAMLNPNANGMACAVREYNGLVFGIQIFVNDPNYTASTQSAASDTSTPVEIAAVVVADSATTETAAN